MIFQGIDVSGSFDITGSFVTAKGDAFPLTASSVQGDMFFHTTFDTMYVFTTSGSWKPIGDITSSTPPSTTANIEYLVIAGGGGGSAGFGNGNGTGGGGAGGMLSSSLSNMDSGSVITVTVGGGGSGGTGTNYSNLGSTNRGADGTNSSIASTSGTSFTTVTSTGGGSGGRGSADQAGNDGGSGGGGGAYSGAGGSGTTGQGNDGGTGTPSGNTNYRGGGGGGKSTAGATGTASGNGGTGEASTIIGTSTTYAGGGGGGCYQGITPGSAGTGGGGAGSAGGNSPGSGTANTGGGGGGSGWPGPSSSTGANGGAGGSGVAIFAYPTSSITGRGGVVTTRSDGHFVHTFNESGTLTLGGSSFMTVAPSENFNVITYSGTGGTQTITGAGFQPDFVWVKNRGTTNAHILTDVLRGAGNVLYSNLTNAQADESAYFTAFSADGFSLAQAGGNTNTNGGSYVAWCWKAGGSGVSNSDGTGITSTVSVNTAAGFSIVKWDATTTVSHTVGHGLSAKPELIIMKNASNSSTNWFVYSDLFDGSLDYLLLNSNAVKANSSRNVPTATVFDQGNLGGVSAGNDCVAYCFHSVPGYSKIGTYTGDGSSSKTVETGFKPAWVIIKNTTTAYRWYMLDNKRDTTNPNNARLFANDNTAEATNSNILNFNSNGFELITSDAEVNKTVMETQ